MREEAAIGRELREWREKEVASLLLVHARASLSRSLGPSDVAQMAASQKPPPVHAHAVPHSLAPPLPACRCC